MIMLSKSQFAMMTLLGLLIPLINLAHGSGVTVIPRSSQNNPGVTFKNAYGYVNVTRTESFAAIGPLTKLGALYFNVSGFESTVGIYYLTIVPFGNGTMILRFPGIVPFQVLHSATSTISYDSTN